MKTPTIKNALLLIGVAVAVTISGLIWPFQDTRPEAVLKRQGARFNYGENGTTVIGVWMEGVEFGDDDVALVVGFPKVRDLSLAGAKVTRRGVEQLRSVTTLPSLDLSHTQLTGDALEVVAQLSGLTDLKLAGCHWVRDEHLELLSPLTHLDRLDLEDTSITPAGLKHLQSLGALTVLRLNRCFAINDAAVEPLCRLSKLQILDLTSCEISSRGAVQLRRELPDTLIVLPVSSLRDLRHLSSKLTFGGTDRGMTTSLGFKAQQLSPGDLGCLNYLTDLASITLDETTVTDEMLMELGTRPALTSLSLRNTLITDEGLKALAGFPNLSNLNLLGTRIAGPGLRHLSHLTQLKTLILDAPSEDELWDALSQLTRLDRLEIHAPLTDAGLLRLPSLPKLTVLEIYDARIAGPGLASLTRAPNLTYLYFSGVPLQDDPFVECLDQLKSLLSVQLIRTGVTREGCERLRKLRSNLNVQWYDPGFSQWVRFE